MAQETDRRGGRTARMTETMTEPGIEPGATIGILGGGQLGRMLAIAASQLGYRSHIFAPEDVLPAADVSAQVTRADYGDLDALRSSEERRVGNECVRPCSTRG